MEKNVLYSVVVVKGKAIKKVNKHIGRKCFPYDIILPDDKNIICMEGWFERGKGVVIERGSFSIKTVGGRVLIRVQYSRK